jgi:hypothetical protein
MSEAEWGVGGSADWSYVNESKTESGLQTLVAKGFIPAALNPHLEFNG